MGEDTPQMIEPREGRHNLCRPSRGSEVLLVSFPALTCWATAIPPLPGLRCLSFNKPVFNRAGALGYLNSYNVMYLFRQTPKKDDTNMQLHYLKMIALSAIVSTSSVM